MSAGLLLVGRLKLGGVKLVAGICLWFPRRCWCWTNESDEGAASENDEVRWNIGALSYER